MTVVARSLLVVALGVACAVGVVSPTHASDYPKQARHSTELTVAQKARVTDALRRQGATVRQVRAILNDRAAAEQVAVESVRTTSRRVDRPGYYRVNGKRAFCVTHKSLVTKVVQKSVVGITLFSVTLTTSVCQQGYTSNGTRLIKKRTYARSFSNTPLRGWELESWYGKVDKLADCQMRSGERWCRTYDAQTGAKVVSPGIKGVRQIFYVVVKNHYNSRGEKGTWSS
ncbi:hypothetical protein ABFU82_06935 [Nocardioides sp. WV_118_6]